MAHLPDDILIWQHIKISAPSMFKAGVNPIEVLLWSRNKTLAEVEQALWMVKNKREFDFRKDRGFVLKKSDENITKEKCHVHFEDDEKLICPRKNCKFTFLLPRVTGKVPYIVLIKIDIRSLHFRC